MYKATARDVRDLQRWGQEDEVVKGLMDGNTQPSMYEIGYQSPASANWAWKIGIAKIGDNHYRLLTRFGVVEGGVQIFVPEFMTTDAKA